MALFEAVSTIPGVVMVPNAVAKVTATKGVRYEIIFDPVKHTVIGRRTIELMELGKPSPAEVSYSTGVVETGIVKQVLLRPDGSAFRAPIKAPPTSQ